LTTDCTTSKFEGTTVITAFLFILIQQFQNKLTRVTCIKFFWWFDAKML